MQLSDFSLKPFPGFAMVGTSRLFFRCQPYDTGSETSGMSRGNNPSNGCHSHSSRSGATKSDRVHTVLEIHGKGGKERPVPPRCTRKRRNAWKPGLTSLKSATKQNAPLFRPVQTARGNGKKRFASRPMSRRAVQKLVEGYILRLKLDPNVTVHSLRVTANAIPDQQSRKTDPPEQRPEQ